MITCYIDGACCPVNPGGYMGWGVWCQDPPIAEAGFAEMDTSNSNNKAEYIAVTRALELLEGYKHLPIEVRTDSMLVAKQMSGAWRVDGGLYVGQYLRARRLARSFPGLFFTWVRRSHNTEADGLSKKALLEHGIQVT